MSIERTEVLIVGAGPAGLAAGIALKQRGVKDVIVVEREDTPGGIPRLCHHTGFGLRDLSWVYSGPGYARHYVRQAEMAGLDIRTSTTATGWHDGTTVAFTSPRGVGHISAQAILLATGCRERPRSARLIPGRRPQGIFTTGSLQRFVYQHRLPVGKRAVIVGAELVSLSALMTLAHAGVSVAALVTELPRHQIYFPYLAAKWWFADVAARVPVITGARVSNLLGSQRLEGVEITDESSGQRETLACDTVVFTGEWIPEHELARLGGVRLDPGTRGPQTGFGFHTATRGVFAAGNLLRGAETADACALEGVRAAQHISDYLNRNQWPAAGLPVQVEPPIVWICPNVVHAASDGSPANGFSFRVRTFFQDAQVTVKQGQREVLAQAFRQLSPNDSMHLDGHWLKGIDLTGEPLRVSVRPG